MIFNCTSEECVNNLVYTIIALCLVIICLFISCVSINCCCCYCFLRKIYLDKRPRTYKIYKNIQCLRENLIKSQTQTKAARYSIIRNNTHNNRYSIVNNNNNNSDNGYVIYDYIERNSLPTTSSHYYESIN